MTALEIAFFTASNCSTWARKNVSLHERQDRVLTVLHGKRMRSSKSPFHMASRGRGNILYGTVRDGELDLNFSDPLWKGDIHFLRGSFRHSLGLWLREAEWSPLSLVLLVGGWPGTWWNGCSQLNWTRLEQPDLTSELVFFKQESGPGGLQRCLAS